MPSDHGATLAPPPPSPPADLQRAAHTLAAAVVRSDIESFGIKERIASLTWWDTRPMVDLREHSPHMVDMANLAIGYAISTGIAFPHPQRPYLLRLSALG